MRVRLDKDTKEARMRLPNVWVKVRVIYDEPKVNASLEKTNEQMDHVVFCIFWPYSGVL